MQIKTGADAPVNIIIPKNYLAINLTYSTNNE